MVIIWCLILSKNINIILIGGGGHAQSCIEILSQYSNYNLLGVFDENPEIKDIFGFKNLFLQNKDIKFFFDKVDYLILGIGFIKNALKRRLIFEDLNYKKFKFINLISKNSIVSRYSKLGEGITIFNNATINAGCEIGDYSILNNNSLIEHNCKISENVHISTGCILNGGIEVGKNTFIGSGVVVNEGLKIGKNCIIGSGTILKKSVEDNFIVEQDRFIKKIEKN